MVETALAVCLGLCSVQIIFQTNSESGQIVKSEWRNHLKRAKTNANNPLILD